jgi:hypothetical protein
MPDIRKVKNSLVSDMKLEIPNIKFDGSDQCDKRKYHEITDGQNPAGPVFPDFLEFY